MPTRSSRSPKPINVMRVKEDVKILSTPYHVAPDKSNNGAKFHSMGSDGKGFMIIGTSHRDPRYIMCLMMHEILEAVLVQSGHAFDETGVRDSEYSKRMFIFHHNDLELIVPAIIDALETCGMIDMPDKISFQGRMTKDEERCSEEMSG